MMAVVGAAGTAGPGEGVLMNKGAAQQAAAMSRRVPRTMMALVFIGISLWQCGSVTAWFANCPISNVWDIVQKVWGGEDLQARLLDEPIWYGQHAFLTHMSLAFSVQTLQEKAEHTLRRIFGHTAPVRMSRSGFHM